MKWGKYISILLGISLVFITLLSAMAHGGTDIVPYSSADDAYVDSTNPNTNYPGNDLHVTGYAFQTERSYIKWQLSSFISSSENILFSVLGVHSSNTATMDVDLHHVTDDTWLENTITYNNQPCGANFDSSANCNLTAESTEYITSIGRYWFDINNMAQDASDGNRILSMVLRTTDTDSTDFYDSNGANYDDMPYLILTHDSTYTQYSDLNGSNGGLTDDTYVTKSSSGNNYGGATGFMVQMDNSNISNRRTYFKYDLTKIPNNVTISDAEIIIKLGASSVGASFTINAHHVYNDSWEEGTKLNAPDSWPNITWSNQPCGTNPNSIDTSQCSGSIAGSVAVASSTTYEPDLVIIDITSLVQSEYAGDKVLSVMLKPSNELSSNQYLSFLAKEDTSDTDILNDPILRVIHSDNSIPNSTTPIITPSSPHKTEDLTCTANYTDANNDTGTMYFRWYKDDVLNLSANITGLTDGTPAASVLGFGNTTAGDNWSCEVRVYDGFAYSSWVNSSSVTITNALPNLTQPVITPSIPAFSQDLNCTTTYTDVNLDNGSVFFEWYKNDVLQSSLSSNYTDVINGTELSAVVGSGNTSEGELWKCSVRATDNGVYIDWQNSTAVNITGIPIIGSIQCYDGSTWVACSAIGFNDNITKIRTDCSAAQGVANVTYILTNIPDSTVVLNESNYTYIDVSFYVLNDTNITIQDSGQWNLTSRCIDTLGNYDEDSVAWLVPWGTLNATYNSPYIAGGNTYTVQNWLFNISANLSCSGGECGDITTYLHTATNISIQPSLDTYVNEASPTTSYGTNTDVRLYSGSGSDAQRIFMRFDTSSIIGRVANAYIYLYKFDVNDGAETVNIHHVSDDSWLESINWNTQPSYNTTVENNTDLSTTTGYYNWSITNMMNNFADSLLSLMLKYNTENAGGSVNTFRSREATGNEPYISFYDLEGVLGSSGFPFYTTTSNPADNDTFSCLNGMVAGDECETQFTVNATGAITERYEFYFQYESDYADVTGYNISATNITIKTENEVPVIESNRTIPVVVKFGNTAYIEVNITDEENDTIDWCNFTVQYPDSSYAINNINGTLQSNNITWHSQTFAINQNGTYQVSIEARDNFTTNPSVSSSFSFDVTDVVTYTPDSYGDSIYSGQSTNFDISLSHDSNETFTFNLADDFNSTYFNVTYSPSSSVSVAEGVTENVTVTITSTNTPADDYYQNITITRTYDGRIITVPVNINVTVVRASLRIYENGTATQCGISNCDWTEVMLTTQTKSQSYTLRNTGVINATECYGTVSGSINQSFVSFSPSNFSVNTTGEVTLTIYYTTPSQGDYTGTLDVECVSFLNGSIAGLVTSPKPDLDLTVTTEGGGGGGGAGTTTTQTIYQLVGDANQTYLFSTEDNTKLYDLYMAPNSERTKRLLLNNMGTVEMNYTITCDGNLCQYLEFSETEIKLLPDFNKLIDVKITIPVEAIKGEQYFAHIVATNLIGMEEAVNIQVSVSKYIGLLVQLAEGTKFLESFNLWSALGIDKLFPDLKPVLIPKWLLFLLPILLFLSSYLIKKRTVRFYVQTGSTVGSFIYILLVIILL